MPADITRRDFLNGTALAIAGGLTPLAQLRAAEAGRYYPPALTGMRGSPPGSFETAHQLGREGKSFDISGLPVEESYDLVVVGGGISGLAAAWFYREAHGPKTRILILDNHDDFGGHAKRNEFRVGDRLLVGYGGTESLQAPKALFSTQVNRLLKTLGVDLGRFHTAFDKHLYPSHGLTSSAFFDRETFGADRLVLGDPIDAGKASVVSYVDQDGADPASVKNDGIEKVVARFPMSEEAQKRLVAFFKNPQDYLPGKTRAQKIEHLKHVSYRDFLKNEAGLGDEALKYFDGVTKDYLATGPDIVPALDAAASLYPGFSAMDLGDDIVEDGEYEPYIYHFPDGNASIARMLVRDLIPKVAPGHGMEDIVLADFDYAQLDRESSPVRIRLNSTAVAVANAKSKGGPVDIGYVTGDKLHRVQGRQTVLACYNMMIPYLMPELPQAQRTALSACVKIPLVYTTVAIRNWHAFVKLGIDQVYCPGAFFTSVKLDFPVSLGNYRFPQDPAEPILLHMVYAPVTPNQGYDNVTQYRMGREILLETPFKDFEHKIVDQLDRMLGPGGFQPSRDIAAITVNRWPHGYAYEFNTLFDKETKPPVYVTARQRFGEVVIANSDAAWNAYTHEAIDQAWRAVGELQKA